VLVAVPKEKTPRERRVALTPEGVKALVKLDCEVAVEAGAGLEAGFPDGEYEAAGARIEASAAGLLGSADLVLKVSPPPRPKAATRSISSVRARPS